MAEEAVASWVYLVYDWGFPPETGRESWRDFGLAVQDYHASGVRVFGRVETSNCIPADSYRGRDWYAVDPRGRPVHYDAGRWMTCWSHPDWLAHLREMVRGIAAAGRPGCFSIIPGTGSSPFTFRERGRGRPAATALAAGLRFRRRRVSRFPLVSTPEPAAPAAGT